MTDWSHHVGLQEGPLQVDVVVIESLVDSGQDCLCHLLASLKTVVSITENFRFNNWHESGCLTRGSVSCQNIGILHDCLVTGSILANSQDTSPLGKLATICLVLLASLVQIIQTLSSSFTLTSKQLFHTFVNLSSKLYERKLDLQC